MITGLNANLVREDVRYYRYKNSKKYNFIMKFSLILSTYNQIGNIIWFGIFFILEYFFPFFEFAKSKIKHAFLNLSLALINWLILFIVAKHLNFFKTWFDKFFIGIFDVIENTSIFNIILAVILFDLWMYFWHRLNHELYFLWRFHRLHHTDPQMDVTTISRFHPVELIISYILNIIILGFLGLNFSFLIIYKTLMLPVIMFHHSNISISKTLDQFFCRLFVMPNMHRIHHSEIREETNSNYGSIFSIWDRLFGTFKTRENIKLINYGIGTFKSKKWQNILGMLLLPFRP